MRNIASAGLTSVDTVMIIDEDDSLSLRSSVSIRFESLHRLLQEFRVPLPKTGVFSGVLLCKRKVGVHSWRFRASIVFRVLSLRRIANYPRSASVRLRIAGCSIQFSFPHLFVSLGTAVS
jgi:hypothetical protein